MWYFHDVRFGIDLSTRNMSTHRIIEPFDIRYWLSFQKAFQFQWAIVILSSHRLLRKMRSLTLGHRPPPRQMNRLNNRAHVDRLILTTQRFVSKDEWQKSLTFDYIPFCDSRALSLPSLLSHTTLPFQVIRLTLFINSLYASHLLIYRWVTSFCWSLPNGIIFMSTFSTHVKSSLLALNKDHSGKTDQLETAHFFRPRFAHDPPRASFHNISK